MSHQTRSCLVSRKSWIRWIVASVATVVTAAVVEAGDCTNKPPHVKFEACRITGGGGAGPGGADQAPFTTSTGARFGGQVGAPCGCIGCFDDFGFIQGQWTHVRKVRKGNFHASEFNSLVCWQDEGEGPEPRPAPANNACFSGIGYLAVTVGQRDVEVAFRVEIQDRGEPGAGQNAAEQPDDYRIRIWVPRTGETAEDLAAGACCTNAEPTGQAGRAPDIDDGGELVRGNLQIHPQTPLSEAGTCPPPGVVCPPSN